MIPYQAQLYDKNKQYMKMDTGEAYTRETLLMQFPTIQNKNAVLLCFNDMLYGVYELDYLLWKYSVSWNESIDIMLSRISDAVLSEKTENTPIERIAAALEFLALQSIPNAEVINEF